MWADTATSIVKISCDKNLLPESSVAWARQSYERYSHAWREGLRVLGCEPMTAPHCGPVNGLAAHFGTDCSKNRAISHSAHSCRLCFATAGTLSFGNLCTSFFRVSLPKLLRRRGGSGVSAYVICRWERQKASYPTEARAQLGRRISELWDGTIELDGSWIIHSETTSDHIRDELLPYIREGDALIVVGAGKMPLGLALRQLKTSGWWRTFERQWPQRRRKSPLPPASAPERIDLQ